MPSGPNTRRARSVERAPGHALHHRLQQHHVPVAVLVRVPGGACAGRAPMARTYASFPRTPSYSGARGLQPAAVREQHAHRDAALVGASSAGT
jgi:hypothetical protein